MDRQKSQPNVIDLTSDDNVDSCPSEIDMSVEPLPSPFLEDAGNIQSLVSQYLGDNTDAMPSPFPEYALPITSSADTSTMDQQKTQPNVIDLTSDESSSKQNVDSCPSEIAMDVEPPPSQLPGDTDDLQSLISQHLEDNTDAMPPPFPEYADNLPSQLLGHVDMTPEAHPLQDIYGEGAVGHSTPPQPSASTQGMTLRELLQAPVQTRQPQMSGDEAKMEEDIEFAEDRILEAESSKSGEEEWSDSYKCAMCTLIGEYFITNSDSTQSRMIEDMYDKLKIRDRLIRDMEQGGFRSRIRRMINKYLELRPRMHDADKDEDKKEKLLKECPYFYHMHKALSYSNAYRREFQAELDSSTVNVGDLHGSN